jgi:hypothetical protein
MAAIIKKSVMSIATCLIVDTIRSIISPFVHSMEW